jgi:hypothetical protein
MIMMMMMMMMTSPAALLLLLLIIMGMVVVMTHLFISLDSPTARVRSRIIVVLVDCQHFWLVVLLLLLLLMLLSETVEHDCLLQRGHEERVVSRRRGTASLSSDVQVQIV